VKKIAGEECPEGWLLDNTGQPTTDPNDLYSEPPGSILPMGGTQGYKGFGLSLMVDIFSGALSAGLCGRETAVTQKGNCVFLMLTSPEMLGGLEIYNTEVNQLVDFVRGCPTVDGVDQILLPGDPERITLERHRDEGLTFDDENWQQLVDLANKLGVSVPS